MNKRISDNQAGGEHVLEQLSAYIDNALDAGERERVSAHIETCDGCRTEHRELKATKQMLFNLPVARPPRAFTLTQEMVGSKPSLWQRLRVPRWYPRLATGSVVAFALLVMLLLGDFAGSRSMTAGLLAEPASTGPIGLSGGTPDAAYKMYVSTTQTAATQAAAVEVAEPTAMAVSDGAESEQATQPATGGAAPEVPATSEPAANTAPAPASTPPAPNFDISMLAGTPQADNPDVRSGRVESQAASPAEPPLPYSPLSDNSVSWAFILQVSLAVLGVALGVGAIIARMRGV